MPQINSSSAWKCGCPPPTLRCAKRWKSRGAMPEMNGGCSNTSKRNCPGREGNSVRAACRRTVCRGSFVYRYVCEPSVQPGPDPTWFSSFRTDKSVVGGPATLPRRRGVDLWHQQWLVQLTGGINFEEGIQKLVHAMTSAWTGWATMCKSSWLMWKSFVYYTFFCPCILLPLTAKRGLGTFGTALVVML